MAKLTFNNAIKRSEKGKPKMKDYETLLKELHDIWAKMINRMKSLIEKENIKTPLKDDKDSKEWPTS